MKSLRLFWLLALLCGAAQPGAAQLAPAPAQYEWLRTAHSPSSTLGNDVDLGAPATDAAGNTYLGITYPGTVRLDGTWYNGANSSQHAALVKLSPEGHVLWFRPMGNVLDSTIWGPGRLTLDAAGNVHALFSGQGQQRGLPRLLEGLPVATGGWTSTYAASWSPQGAIRSAALLCHGGPQAGTVNVMAHAAAAHGDVVVAGSYLTTALFDTVVLHQNNPLPGRTDGNLVGFIARFTATGQLRWVHEMEDTDPLALTNVLAVNLDAADNAYVMGGYAGTTGLGGYHFSPTAGAGLQGARFWAKLNPAGRVVGARTFDMGPIGPLGSHGRLAFRVRPDGCSFASWAFTQPCTLMPGLSFTPTGKEDLLITAYDSTGVVQWGRQVGGTDAVTALVPFDLELKGNTRLYVSAFYGGEVTTNGIQLPLFNHPIQTTQQGAVMAFEQENGRGLWALPTTLAAGRRAHWLRMTPGGPLLSMLTRIDTVRLGNLVAVLPPSVSSNSVLARITESYNTLHGAVYLDANADGVQNPGEGGFPNGLIVEANPGALPCVAPAATGRYDAYPSLLNTAYTITLPNPPTHYTVLPQGPAVSAPFATFGGVAAGRSFALQPIANRQDVQVFLTQITPARPGFPASYDLTYRNTGTVALPTGTVTLTADPRLTFVSASAAPATTTGATRTWPYANLAPGESRRLRVLFTLPSSTPLGEVVESSATLTPLLGDLLPADNTATARRVVSGSFDPNDIEVNHLLLTTTQVAAGEWLEYTIRFQNHGTDTAFTVAIHDSISAALLRISSFQFLAASHTCGYGVNALGQLIVTFPGIRLPSQATDLVNSDGFIRFRVQPITTLVAGDQIPNQAQIHFDYNVPLATNTALTVIGSTLGTGTGTGGAPLAGARPASVWPNPASGTLHVEAARTQAGTLLLTLCDGLGRVVLGQPVAVATPGLARATLDVSRLPAGLYLLRGAGAGAAFAQRVVVR